VFGALEYFRKYLHNGFMKRQTMSQIQAHACCRVLVAINNQINKAMREGREEDWKAMSRLLGGLEFHMFGLGSKYEPTSPWKYIAKDQAAA
jgi:hypothetical protein